MNTQIIRPYHPSQAQINRENKLKSLRPYLIVLLIAFTCSAQYIENSFPAPSEHITGLSGYGYLYAIDSLQNVIYEINPWSGEIFDTIPIPWIPCSPVGLAIPPTGVDSLIFAESGSAMIRVMTLDGDSLGSIDLSVHGLQSITGLSSFYPSDKLHIMDAATSTIYEYTLPLGSGNISVLFTLQSCPEVHDIAMTYYGVAVACEDSLSPVRIYESESFFVPIEYAGTAVGIGTASEGNRFYFNDPDTGMIHRYCMDMGGISGHGESNPEIKYSIPNPVEGDTEMQLHLQSSGEVHVIVSDISGREVMFIYEGGLAEGTHSIPVYLKDLPSGVYLMNVRCDDSFSVTEFTLLNSSR